ncbi:unnamed protein product [Boreogadus saida]
MLETLSQFNSERHKCNLVPKAICIGEPLQGPDVSPLADYSHSRGQMFPPSQPLQGPDVSPLAGYRDLGGQMCPHWLTTATPGARCVPTG